MDANEIIKNQEQLASARSVWEAHWREIAPLVLPRADMAGLRTLNAPGGNKQTEKLFDSTAVMALERFAAAMESMLTPRTQRWHRLQAQDTELHDDHEVRDYLDEVVDILFLARYAPKANFAGQINEVYMSLGAFGTGSLLLEDDPGVGIRYRANHLGEMFFSENPYGVIDTIHRRFEYTARQAAMVWGADNLPGKIGNSLITNAEQKYEFIHCVCPNNDVAYQHKGVKGWPWISVYVSIEGRKIMGEGGFQTMPYAVSRYVTGPKEIYGRSPAMSILPEIKMINEMAKVTIQAAQKVVNPPLMAFQDDSLASFSMVPGSLNWGGVNERGEQLIHPLTTQADIGLGLEMEEQRRRMINDAFLVTLFQILVQQPNMTATEALLRAQEKGALLAPTMGRQQSELLGPIIQRELDILARAGALPPMPRKLIDRNGELKIEYISPLNRAQRSEEGVAILRTLESITPLAQIDPTVLDVFEPEEIARELAEINGVPAKILRSKEEVKALKDQRAQAAQAQALLQAAPIVSGTVRDIAQTGQAIGQVPQPLVGMQP